MLGVRTHLRWGRHLAHFTHYIMVYLRTIQKEPIEYGRTFTATIADILTDVFYVKINCHLT